MTKSVLLVYFLMVRFAFCQLSLVDKDDDDTYLLGFGFSGSNTNSLYSTSVGFITEGIFYASIDLYTIVQSNNNNKTNYGASFQLAIFKRTKKVPLSILASVGFVRISEEIAPIFLGLGLSRKVDLNGFSLVPEFHVTGTIIRNTDVNYSGNLAVSFLFRPSTLFSLAITPTTSFNEVGTAYGVNLSFLF